VIACIARLVRRCEPDFPPADCGVRLLAMRAGHAAAYPHRPGDEHHSKLNVVQKLTVFNFETNS